MAPELEFALRNYYTGVYAILNLPSNSQAEHLLAQRMREQVRSGIIDENIVKKYQILSQKS